MSTYTDLLQNIDYLYTLQILLIIQILSRHVTLKNNRGDYELLVNPIELLQNMSYEAVVSYFSISWLIAFTPKSILPFYCLLMTCSLSYTLVSLCYTMFVKKNNEDDDAE